MSTKEWQNDEVVAEVEGPICTIVRFSDLLPEVQAALRRPVVGLDVLETLKSAYREANTIDDIPARCQVLSLAIEAALKTKQG